jgi:hypothetical protein
MIKRKDELEKRRLEPLLAKDKMTFVNSVVVPAAVITAMKAVFELVVKPPGGGHLDAILIGNAIFFAMLFLTACIVYLVLKRKMNKLDSAPQINSFLPGNSIEKFRPIEMRTPSEYPMHPEFGPAANSLKTLRFFLLFSCGGLALIIILSMMMGMSQHNIFVFLGFLVMLALPVWYVITVVKGVEDLLRENSFHLAHSEIYELELVLLSRDLSQQHMMYKLCIKMGNTLKNYHVRPMPNCDKNFSELGLLQQNCPQIISVHISPVTGEPLALATQNGPIWLSNAEVRLFFLPPRPGTKLLTMARPLVPLEYDKGIKLLADKSSKGLQDDKFVGTWQGLTCFDRTPNAQYRFWIKLAQAPNGGLSGTYHNALLGPLYGKVTLDGKALGNELYLNVVYHFWLWKLFEKPELWAGIYDPATGQVTGTFRKGSLTGTFVLSKDFE